MNAWRTSIMARRRTAVLLVALALFAKLFVPTGYMFTPTAGGFVVQMCSGQGATPVVLDIGRQAPVEDHGGSGKMDAPCAFSTIGMATTSAVDAILLVSAIAFVIALGTRQVVSTVERQTARLRPPLRAPPAFS
jgi:hypothetical protein